MANYNLISGDEDQLIRALADLSARIAALEGGGGGPQTITLTGDVTGSGTGTIAAAVAANLKLGYRYLGEFAYASLPAASGNQYCYALATDIGIAPGTLHLSDNARWVPVLPRYGFDGGSWFAPLFTNFNSHLGTWVPPGNSTGGPGVTGMVALTGLGTAAARNVATTNAMTLLKRLGRDSAATAGSFSGHYSTAQQIKLGDDSGLGGFLFTIIFGCSDAATVSGARQFVGMSNNIGAPTNVEPSTLTNSVGVGHGASDTNLQIYFAGTVTQTPIDLGANFPVNTLSADAYLFALYSPINPTAAGYKAGWYIKRLGTTYSANGTLNGTSGTVLPNTATIMCAPRAWRCNNATALAASLDIGTTTLAIPSL